MRWRQRVLGGALLVVGLAGTACLGSDATSGDAPVARPAQPEPPPPDAGAPDDPVGEPVEPTPGMLDVRPVPWDEAQVDGTTVTVSWWSGMAPCDVLDRVEVVEGGDEVVITLVEGDAEPAPSCRLATQRKSTAVELEEPVGKRQLVDGAAEAS